MSHPLIQSPAVPLPISSREIVLRPTLRVVQTRDRVVTIGGIPDVCFVVSNSRNDEAAFARIQEVIALLVD